MSDVLTSGQFLDGARGPVLVVLREPREPSSGCVLVVPPFAEEMNKCRRMTTEVALALAGHRMSSVVPDLFGTGDSGGDFADADWTTWHGDLARVCRWCREQGRPITGVLAVRLGCALAVSAIESGAIAPVERTVFWQPTFDGGRFLNQFLRQRIAVSRLQEGRPETMSNVRALLASDHAIEVAGYCVSERLVAEMEAIVPPQRLPGELGAMWWMEIVREAGADLPPPAAALVERSRGAGGNVTVLTFTGDPFWAATEIVTNEAMLTSSVDALTAGRASHATVR